jgi:hypothetical protein
MKLPNAEKAVVAERKLTSYLLDETHPSGKHKAAFFKRFGFETEKWTVLKMALLQHATAHEIAGTLRTEEGTHYVLEGDLQTPDGRNPQVRSVWAIDTGSDVPRFITAYPLD